VACKWHPLTAMENAAKDGLSYSPAVDVLPIKCSGAATVASLLKLFAKGLEGVLVLGCADSDCHYFNGAERCDEIIAETREILELSGIAGARLGFYKVADTSSKEFIKALKGFLAQLKTAKTREGRVASTRGR
jgi:coenzyme F420-reducing hydrogenase delta subunit